MILVTGGSGYIGGVLVRRFLDKGYRVRVLDAGYFGHEALRDIKDKIELVEDDIRSCGPEVMKGIEHVVHLAGFSNDPTAEYRPKENFAVNVDGTRNIVGLAKDAGVKKFIFASSCSVYYTTNPDDVFEKSEDHFITPSVPYSLSKHMAEDVVLGAKSSTFTPVVFRKGTVYGLSPRMRYDLVVNTMLKDAFKHKRIVLHQGGRMWRPLTDVETVAAGYIWALENNIDGIYNLVDMNILVRDLADEIQRTLYTRCGEMIEIERQDVGVSRSYRVSGERLRKRGFFGSHPLQEAIVEMWNDLKNSGRDLDHSKYYNIRVFEELFADNKNNNHGNHTARNTWADRWA